MFQNFVFFSVLLFPEAGEAKDGRGLREEKKKTKRTKQLSNPDGRVLDKKRNRGNREEEEKQFLSSNSANNERPQSEKKKGPHFLASDSVNNKTKSEKRKNSVDGRKGKKSSVDGRSVSSMMRRKERGGCPALGEGLFPDVTTGCQVEFHGSDLRHNHSFHHIHVQEFYMCHNRHCMGQFTFTFTFIFMKLSLSLSYS